jgi:hypothetical protein
MGQACETVTVQHERAKEPRQVRISVRVKAAIVQMIDHGLKRADAAQIAGLTDNALYIALRKPEVLAYRNERMRVFRESAASRSIARVDQLADASTSESVKFESNKLLLGLEGITPVQRTENVHLHQHVIPGLTVIREGWRAHDPSALLIDGQAHEVRSAPVINRIGQSVPHPEAGNVLPPAVQTDGLPANRGGRAKAPRGAK